MKPVKSQGELSEGSFSVNQTNPNGGFSGGTTPNTSFAGGTLSFGTLNMMEHLARLNEREDNDWKDLEAQIRNTTHSPQPQGASPGNNNSEPARGPSPGSSLIPSVVNSEVKFFEYPHLPPDTAGRTVAPPEESGCVKLFMGNMRFEMKRGTIAWAIKKACGTVDIDPSRVLIHYKSSNGSQTPTGCASVFMEPQDASALLEFNQRIFCGATGVYVSLTSEAMRTLLRDRRVLDVGPDGRVRGPKHAVVIEMSRATPNNGSFSNNNSLTNPGGYRPPLGAGPLGIGTSPPHSNNHSFARSNPRRSPLPAGDSPQNTSNLSPGTVQPPSNGGGMASSNSSMALPSHPPTQQQQQQAGSPNQPVYHVYPGLGAELAEPQALVNPTEFFVGGICYEATPHFVAWMVSLTGVKIHSQNVTLFEDNKTGGKRGCAMVKVDGAVFPQIRAYHHRLLCDSRGVYVAETTQGIPAFIRQQKANGEVLRGPSHAVVIEKRRAQATPPPAYGTDGPPPPPYLPGSVPAIAAPTTSWTRMPPVTASHGLPSAQPAMLGKGIPLTAPQPGSPYQTTPPNMPLGAFVPPLGGLPGPRPDAPPSPTMMAMNPQGLPRAMGTPPSVSLTDVPVPTWKEKKDRSTESTPRGGASETASACGGN